LSGKFKQEQVSSRSNGKKHLQRPFTRWNEAPKYGFATMVNGHEECQVTSWQLVKDIMCWLSFSIKIKSCDFGQEKYLQCDTGEQIDILTLQ
jgi:hypothetical protein